MKKRIVLIALICLCVLSITGCDSSKYKKAMEKFDNGEYAEAAELFDELGDYEDSQDMALESYYEAANEMFAAGDYAGALEIYEEIQGDYDVQEQITKAKMELMYETYGDVISKLQSTIWFYNGGNATTLGALEFSEEGAVIHTVAFSGNGKMSSEDTFDFLVDESNIILMTSEGEKKISYSLSGDKLTLDNGSYMSTEDVDAGLQGCWKYHKSEMILGMYTESEHNIKVSNGTLVAENASLAYGYTDGTYYYYGPYTGSYTLNIGGFDTSMSKGYEYFFNIIDGKPTVLHWGDVCSPTNSLPGEDGYSF